MIFSDCIEKCMFIEYGVFNTVLLCGYRTFAMVLCVICEYLFTIFYFSLKPRYELAFIFYEMVQ